MFCSSETMKLFVINAFVISLIVILSSIIYKHKFVPVVEIIKSNGYGAENHHTTTEDGYILGLQRILTKGSRFGEAKEPLLILHGLTSSAADFVAYLDRDSLPFLLAERGYDVWLGNCRGTPESSNHLRLDIHAEAHKFWNFSIHEFGYYDLPAMIDYILMKTGHKKLFYIGYSQGGMVFFVMTSSRPDYNKKIEMASLLAPIVRAGEPNQYTKDIHTASKVWPMLEWAHKIGADRDLTSRIARNFCAFTTQFNGLKRLCKFFYLEMYVKWDSTRTREELVPKVFQHSLIETGLKNLAHFLQLFNKKKYQQYDYGTKGNLIQYGSENPPQYDSSLVTAPVAIYYCHKDSFMSTNDMTEFAGSLRNLRTLYAVPDERFSHVDFLLTNDVQALVYEPLINNIENFNKTFVT